MRSVCRPYCTLIIVALVLQSCGSMIDKRVTLWRNDKIPYGTYYAFHTIHYFFPHAKIETSNVSPADFDAEDDSSSAYIVIGNTVRPDEKELNAMLSYAASGNHVFISAVQIGDNLLDSFHLCATKYGNVYNELDSLSLTILHPYNDRSSSFAYPGLEMANVFKKMDSSVTTIVGRDADGNANFVKFTYRNGGSICLHLAPAAFTNFFLLHKNNKQYYDLAISQIPASVRQVRWDDYYRHHIDGLDDSQRSGFSKLAAFMQHPVLRWAFWLTVALFSITYLFESKRRQRPVPVEKKLQNTSLEFVQTIGRLYYQRHDNRNLASKMSAHFMGHVRNRYNLPAAAPDDEFASALSFRSGYPLEKIKEIISFIARVDNSGDIRDEELLAFSNKTDEFYKQA